ncbi:peptidase M15 [Actinomadura craniellae]|uniref:Peptidase M15 n=1 Tax=Actinomadura craniellae TaxID=2231787 RepID=A0A365H7E6_9ACTN|nr:M15 family metallopeptidase [Actinomadura craniellae]RAY15040.1 peptidase M15 [Actinomadura craniellae]
MPTPRSASLVAVFSVMALLVLTSAPPGYVSLGQAAQQAADPIETLRRQATKARTDLEKATKQWESRRTELARSQVKLREALRELAKAEAEWNRIREPLARLANATYQQPGALGSMAIFGPGSTESTLRAAADVTHLANAQEALIKQATVLQDRRQRLATTVQELQSRNAVEQTRLLQQINALKQRSAQLTKDLTELLDRMRISRDRRLALACDRDLVADARRFPNGLIPDKYLCDLPQRGHTLRADAALGFYKLNSAYKQRFGRDMCVTDAYRSLGEQQSVYYRRPGFAAVPGRSNHGLGTALDLCGGVQIQGSAQFNWLEANSRRYGWFHPRWAYSSPFEPWHWEFGSEYG